MALAIKGNSTRGGKSFLRQKLIFPFIAIAFSILISFIMSEVILRIAYRDYQIKGDYWGIGAFSPHDKAGFTHKSGYEGYVYRKNAFRSFVKINHRGLRQSDLEAQLKFPKQLLILGDSFPFGLGVSEEHTFPHLIKKNLNPLDIGIINGAQSGYSIKQSFFFGKELIKEFNPSMIILSVFAQNDIRDDYLEEYKNIDVRFGSQLSRKRKLKSWIIDLFRTHSYTYLLIQKYFNQIRNRNKRIEFRYTRRTYLHEVIQPSLSNLLELKSLCKEKGILFGVMIIPPKKGNSVFDDLLIEFFNKEKIPALDLKKAEFQKIDFLKKDGHWNEKGHARASLLLSEFVKILTIRK